MLDSFSLSRVLVCKTVWSNTMKSMREAITTIRSIIFHGFLMYGGKPFYLRVALLNKNPWAMILMQASMVNKTVKQLSR